LHYLENILGKKMKADLIPKFWRNASPAKTYNKSYWTDGVTLYSYDLVIGTTMPDGSKILYDYTSTGTFISLTTSKHVNTAARYADEKIKSNSFDF
jgi:hypothetical protein